MLPTPLSLPLQKGAGFHLDLLCVSLLMVVTSVTGLPWYVSATVISLAHMESLRKESTTSAPGEHPKFLGIRCAMGLDPALGGPLPMAARGQGCGHAGRQAWLWGCLFLPRDVTSPHGQQSQKEQRPWGLGGQVGTAGPEGPQGIHDTCAATHREQRLTGLAVFVLTGVSVFMAPVLKVKSLAAAFGLFSKVGVVAITMQGLEVPNPNVPNPINPPWEA